MRILTFKNRTFDVVRQISFFAPPLKTTLFVSFLGAAAIFGGACTEPGPARFSEAKRLGGVMVDAATLNRGQDVYSTYCRTCHGAFGDGKGALGVYQKPPARDLRLGIIKYASVRAGDLPLDEDLARSIRRGIKGTAMLPIPLRDEEMKPLIQYLKTFSPRWSKEKAGAAIAIAKDPWTNPTEAAQHGSRIYHLEARCASCHPAYLDQKELASLSPQNRLRLPQREALHRPTTTDSSYGPIQATRLRKAPLKNGTEPEELYRVIAAGIGGTSMPTWKGALSEKDLWSLVHYIRELRGDS